MTTFEIPGKPFAKQRPRFNSRSRRSYTPQATVSFENTVRQYASDNFAEPIEGPVRVTVRATFEPAKSWSKKKTAEHLNRPHTQKPDGDNIIKAILDGMNRIAYADDAQVCDQRVVKVWGPVARTVVTVEALS